MLVKRCCALPCRPPHARSPSLTLALHSPSLSPLRQVGQLQSSVEDRSHFGAWCITSSPLILGYDMAKDAITDRVWHIITNEAAIAVNQDWAGSPGHFVRELGVDNNTDTNNSVVAVACTSGDPTQVGWAYDDSGHRVTLDLNRQLLSQCLDGSRGRDHLVDNCHAQYGADDKYCLDHTNADNLEVRACQADSDAQELAFDGRCLRSNLSYGLSIDS